MKTKSEIEEQIAKIRRHIKEAEEAAPELIWCRARIQALSWVLE